jgi:hypothetical protein
VKRVDGVSASMNLDQQLDSPLPVKPTVPKRKEREERPKFNLKEDEDYRISGLEKAKHDPSMSQADIAALDRVIVKLKEKKAEKTQAKQED